MAKKANKKKNSNGNKNKNYNSKQTVKNNVVENQKKSDVTKVVTQNSGNNNQKKDKNRNNGNKKNNNKVVVKETKKNGQPRMDMATNNELKKLGIIIIVLLIIFFIFYGITKLVNNGKDNYEYNFEDDVPVEIQYDEILVGEILNQNRNEYYVLLERSEDVSVDLYKYHISRYASTQNALKVYTVNVDNPFNKGYIAEKSNLKVSDVSKMKISETALLHVKNKKVIASYEGKDKIVSQLKNQLNN